MGLLIIVKNIFLPLIYLFFYYTLNNSFSLSSLLPPALPFPYFFVPLPLFCKNEISIIVFDYQDVSVSRLALASTLTTLAVFVWTRMATGCVVCGGSNCNSSAKSLLMWQMRSLLCMGRHYSCTR